jgi:hypothetical protein
MQRSIYFTNKSVSCCSRQGANLVKEFEVFVRTSLYLKANTDGRVSLREFPSAEMTIPFLWREDQNVDSDGDEEGDEKIFKYLQNREKPEEKFTIKRVKKDGDLHIYRIASELEYIAARVAYFLASVLDGKVSNTQEGIFFPAQTLLNKMGKDFDVMEGFKRAKQSPYWEKT